MENPKENPQVPQENIKEKKKKRKIGRTIDFRRVESVKKARENPLCSRLENIEIEDICRWRGEGFSNRDIIRLYKNKYKNSDVFPYMLTTTLERLFEEPTAQKKIAFHRMHFLKSVKEIPITDKKVRLDDMENIRQKLRAAMDNIHFSQGPRAMTRFLQMTKRIIEVLDMARSEMEPKSGVSVNIGLGQGEMGELSDEQLQTERNNLLRKAGLSVERGSSAVDEAPEGDEGEGEERPTEVLLAAPKELRGQLPGSGTFVPDI